MGQIRTHYDNLQVSRSATPEVILAAYRALSLRYDPDRNGGDAKCVEVMRLVNKSFAILMDTPQRKAHDEWIAMKEAQASHSFDQSNGVNSTKPRSGQNPPRQKFWQRIPLRTVFRATPPASNRQSAIVLALATVALVIFMSFLPSRKPEPSGLPPYHSTPTEAPVAAQANQTVAAQTAAPSYVRPAAAPNGSAWPKSAGYISQAPLLRTGGLSTVKVDNSGNTDDVFVKLVSIEPVATMPVRQFFVPAGERFTVKGLTPGQYDVRYRNLSDGKYWRTEDFALELIPETDGTRFSAIEITLYAVRDGHMVTYPLMESEF